MARRALLTPSEREALSDPETKENPYVAVTRVRQKIEEELPRDVRVLEEHRPDLLEELRDVVCAEVDARPAAGAAAPAEANPRPEPQAGPAGSHGAADDEAEAVLASLPAGVDRETVEQLRDELAGSGDVLEARVKAILQMYAELQERGTAEKGDLLEAADIEATRYQDRNSVWANMVKGRETLRALPGVESPPSGRSEWTYSG
jgi:hypothetical protein